MRTNDDTRDEISIDEDNVEISGFFPDLEGDESVDGENEGVSSPVTKRRGRGKASGELKLSSALLETNAILQEKFVCLRQSIFVAEDLSRQERVRQQRHILAEILGIHARLVRAIEKTQSPLPATVLFALIERFNLPANYFTVRGVALSQQFVLEQKMRELEWMQSSLRSQIGVAASGMGTSGSAPVKRGGWLKGLPRKITCEHDAHLLAMWKEAKKRNFHPASVEDMLRWADTNNVTLEKEVMEVPVAKKAKKHPARRAGSAGAKRHSGWMLGLARSPRTAEQREHLRIWQIAKSRNLHFDSVKEMMAWWVVEGKK